MLTVEMLKGLKPGMMFAAGCALDSPGGLFMANTGKMLRWVAVRGEGYHDWCIYAHLEEHDVWWIRSHGDKVTFQEHIKRLVPCDDAAFALYRY